MESKVKDKRSHGIIFVIRFTMVLLLIIFTHERLSAQDVLNPQDVFNIKSCTGVKISPDGKWIAYTVRVQREIQEKPGRAYNELYMVSTTTREIIPFICGKVNVSSPRWSPDGSRIAFLKKRDEEEQTQIWAISTSGGESQQLSYSKTDVLDFRWHPKEKKIAYIATSPKSKHERHLAKRGYDFIFYEENLKHRNLYLLDITDNTAEKLTRDKTVWNFEFSPDGKKIAASISPKNLIDHRYMFRKIHILDLENNSQNQLTDNQGKLGNYTFNPEGSKIAYAAALNREDHQISQAYIIDVTGGEAKNLTTPGFKGHVNWVGWKDTNTVMYRAGEGVWPTLSTISIDMGETGK